VFRETEIVGYCAVCEAKANIQIYCLTSRFNVVFNSNPTAGPPLSEHPFRDINHGAFTISKGFIVNFCDISLLATGVIVVYAAVAPQQSLREIKEGGLAILYGFKTLCCGVLLIAKGVSNIFAAGLFDQIIG
jgi:hypothetical protein